MAEPRQPASPPTVPMTSTRGLLAYLAASGHPPAEVLQSVGLEPSLLDDPDGRVPGPQALALWQEAERLTADADLGLHIAERHPPPMGVFDYAVRAADTLGDAWQRACDYYRLVDGAARLTLTRHDSSAELGLELPVPLPRSIPELVLASFVLRGREASGHDWAPRKISFGHPKPADTGAHQRIFRCPLHFSAKRYVIEVAAEVLELPQPGADSGLAAVLDGYATELLARLPREDRFADRVRGEVTRRLGSGDAGAEAVAKRLGVSARTLHRRLRAEGTNHRRIVDEIRQLLALRHLDDGQLAVSEVAFLLGYSETSAFHRAFRRWQGCSPSAYQRSVR